MPVSSQTKKKKTDTSNTADVTSLRTLREESIHVLTEDDLGVQVVREVGDELTLDGHLMVQQRQVSRQVLIICSGHCSGIGSRIKS